MLNVQSQKHDVIKLFTNSLFTKWTESHVEDITAKLVTTIVLQFISVAQVAKQKQRSSLQFSVQENYDENIECNLLWITAFAKCINVHFTLLFQLQKQLLFFFAEWIIKNEEIEFPNIDYRNAHSVKETVISGEICVRLI